MKFYDVTEEIDAPPEKVWGILTDGDSYSQWDNGIDKLEGRIAPGETIKLYVKVNPGRAFPLKVTEFTIWPSIPDLGPSFQQFAKGLKARAES